MGAERFSATSYRSYTRDNSFDTLKQDQIFTSRNIPQALDPRKIIIRESCDSTVNPNSTPLIFGLDVTGSMGFIAEAIAKDGLPTLMERVYAEAPVADPHVMFMGIGDINCDQGPLQVSQFEAGALVIVEQLRQLWLEKGGGGNNFESYDLPWYFAAHKTQIDSFDKRGQKGLLFTFGDELPPQQPLRVSQLQRVFGEGQLPDPGTTKQLLTKVQEKYKVFHIIVEEGNYCRGRKVEVHREWTELLGPNAIFMRDHKYLPDIVVATLKIAGGADINEVISESQCRSELAYAFSNALS